VFEGTNGEFTSTAAATESVPWTILNVVWTLLEGQKFEGKVNVDISETSSSGCRHGFHARRCFSSDKLRKGNAASLTWVFQVAPAYSTRRSADIG
jgi:hypothetical protein